MSVNLSRPLLALALLVLVAPTAASQDPVYSLGGPELFQAWLRVAEVEPYTVDELARGIDARKSILVVWGTSRDRAANADWMSYAQQFLSEGGAVLIASHEGWHFQRLTRGLADIRITGDRLEGDGGPLPIRFMKPLPAPFNELVAPEVAGLAPLEQVWDTSPSTIVMHERAGPFQQVLGRIADSPFAFAVGGVGPRDNPYRFLVYADQHVFSNGMLVNSPENFRFAGNTVRFLRGPEQRSRCLFLDHGRVVNEFPLEFSTPPMPDVPVPLPSWRKLQSLLADGANRVMDRLETDDTLNRKVLGRDPDSRMAEYLLTLAMIGAVWAVIHLLRKVWRSRQPADPVLTTSRVGGPPASSVLGRRGEELLRRDNLLELAQAEVRDLFRSTGAPDMPGAELPPIEYPHGRSRTLEEQLRRLWQLGYGTDHPVLRSARWQEFEATVAAVREAAANGHWRFAPAGNAA